MIKETAYFWFRKGFDVSEDGYNGSCEMWSGDFEENVREDFKKAWDAWVEKTRIPVKEASE